MAPRLFTVSHRVSYAECTVGNHVYHSRYLDILERARGEFFRSLGCPLLELQEADAIFPVIECAMKFRGMARYDDLLTVELWVSEMGRARFSCAARIKDEAGGLLFEAVTHLACTTVAGRPRRLPEGFSAALQPFLAPVGGRETSPD
jgi:acyl-CoA thioester hydrolase